MMEGPWDPDCECDWENKCTEGVAEVDCLDGGIDVVSFASSQLVRRPGRQCLSFITDESCSAAVTIIHVGDIFMYRD